VRALAAGQRRAQIFLRALGIEITSVAKAELETTSCGCNATIENTVSTVGSVSEYEPWLRTASTGR
jgi:hypothetical protein